LHRTASTRRRRYLTPPPPIDPAHSWARLGWDVNDAAGLDVDDAAESTIPHLSIQQAWRGPAHPRLPRAIPNNPPLCWGERERREAGWRSRTSWQSLAAAGAPPIVVPLTQQQHRQGAPRARRHGGPPAPGPLEPGADPCPSSAIS